MDFQASANLDHNTSIDLDESRVFDMRDLVSSEIDVRSGAQVRARDVVQFVILARKRHPSPAPEKVATRWSIPTPQEFYDLLNRSECYMIQKRLPCYKAQKWINLWGKVGLVGLSPKHPQYLEDYRTVIEGQPSEHLTFTIFPRDAVDNRGSISVLLREKFREFVPTCLPAVLFLRNRGLKGSLRVTHTKTYGSNEKNRGGQSKAGWRLILLQGCGEFMKSLESFEEDEKFNIGCGYVYIKGGVRKPKSSTHRGAPIGRGGRSHRGTGGARHHSEPNNNYNEDYPRASTHTGRRSTGGAGFERSERSPDRGGRHTGPGRRAPHSAWGRE